VFAADPEFIQAVQDIYRSIEDEIKASREGAKAWATKFYEGQELRKEALDRVIGALDPK